MKKKILLGIIAVCIIFTIGMITWKMIRTKGNSFIQSKDIYKVECKEETKQSFFSNYQDFSKTIKTDKVKEKDFKKYNFYLFSINFNSCGEKNITPTNYEIKNNKINITVKYESTCGNCASRNIYYILKVKKEMDQKEIIIDYQSIKSEKCDNNIAYKPIIYLYPEEEMKIEVKLLREDNLILTYPKYQNSWKVLAKKDGTLKIEDREYYGLYWEGKNHKSKETEEGFIVKGENTSTFLEEKLKILGLTDKEANEFIIYWLPQLEKNKYNYIRFESIEEINDYMPLSINPEPTTIIRIQMDFKPLNKKIIVKEQKLTPNQRKGFTVVEWGGSRI